MNLRDLHYIVAVADALNFKLAGNICHVSQPTLSMQIKKVEDRLGVQLFERSNKRVRATEAGRQIVEIARRILQEEKQIREVAASLRDLESGEFRLGAFPTLASYVFPRYVPVLLKAFPKMRLLLAEERSSVLLEKLVSGDLDAALLALPVKESRLKAEHLFDDPFLLAVGPDHPLARRKSICLSELKGDRLLLLDEGHCLRDQALAICGAKGPEEQKSFRATSLETLRLMVQAPHSGLMTLMPRIAVSPADTLKTIPFKGRQPYRSIGLCWRKTDARFSVIAKMSEALRQSDRR
jgi:LysR family hydrogen peroxide-inducible transcriptional activator